MLHRFGEFAFDPDRGLLRSGEAVDLEPRASDLLRYLIENQGRVVTRDELCEHVWHGSIVSDAAISTQVRAVRKALCDDRERQRFIRTHPRRGYSFVGTVESFDSRGQVEAWAHSATPSDTLARNAPVAASLVARLLGPLKTPGRLGIFALVIVIIAAIGLWNQTRDAGGPLGGSRDLSIAVLPFENLSGDADKNYIADAFTEDLITDLSRIRDAFVISRSTSFTYRGKEVDAQQVAMDLGIRYVLEGSLRIEGDKVRINAQLIDGADNSSLWADRYGTELDDLFELQDNVTGRIASVLRAELRKADNERQDPEITRDAWDYALRGNVLLFNHQSVTDYQEAYAYLSKAVGLDPGISSAWGGLAFVHFVASSRPIPDITRPDSAELSLAAALKATEADPMNAEPYWLVGAGYARTGQPQLGMSACRTAIDLNPNMDCGHVCAGLVHMSLGEPGKAVPYFKHALELNPRFRPFTKQKYLGLAYIQTGDNDPAISALNRALAGDPHDGFANLAMSAALALDNQIDAAQGVLSRHFRRTGARRPTLAELKENLGWLGPGVERMLSGLQRAGLSEM